MSWPQRTLGSHVATAARRQAATVACGTTATSPSMNNCDAGMPSDSWRPCCRYHAVKSHEEVRAASSRTYTSARYGSLELAPPRPIHEPASVGSHHYRFECPASSHLSSFRTGQEIECKSYDLVFGERVRSRNCMRLGRRRLPPRRARVAGTAAR